METLHGLVEHSVYHNENNGYTVLALMCQGDEIMCTGTMAMVNEGEYIKAEGDYVEHATYGRQFRIASFSIEAPEDLFSIERYLGSALRLSKMSRNGWRKSRVSASGRPRRFISSFMISRICVRQ